MASAATAANRVTSHAYYQTFYCCYNVLAFIGIITLLTSSIIFIIFVGVIFCMFLDVSSLKRLGVDNRDRQMSRPVTASALGSQRCVVMGVSQDALGTN